MLDKLKIIPWKLVGLFFLKLFLYLIIIPISAYIFQLIAFGYAVQWIFKVKHVSGPAAIGLRMWSSTALVTYSLFFYIYVWFNRYVKSKSLRNLMLLLFILFPGFMVGSQFTEAKLWAIIGNWVYCGYLYIAYYIMEYFLPSYRGNLKNILKSNDS